jgi:fumarylacetoacetase
MAKSWLPIPSPSPFSLANIPFGIISTKSNSQPRPAVAIGEHALDLQAFSAGHGFSKLESVREHLSVFASPKLNDLATLGLQQEVRKYVQAVFTENGEYKDILESNHTLQKSALLRLEDVKNHVPFHIGDYTDFYAGLNHAFNVGVLFRGADNALQPNYKHLPVGYHGRASTVIVSGTPIRRPRGQILANPAANPKEPTFSACKKLDMELELAAFVSRPNEMGSPIDIADAGSHIFGYVLMNDWSARDIQAWEYVPLGPFNSKNFGTTISPWVVLPEALEPFRAEGLHLEDQAFLPYLTESRKDTFFNIDLEVQIKTAGSSTSSLVTKTNSKNLLYSFPQMLAHHTVTGCAMNTGDLLGSGTISGTAPGTLGSLLEQTNNGKEAVAIGDTKRTFLEDGDEVIIKGNCGSEGEYVGFGECSGIILPAWGA